MSGSMLANRRVGVAGFKGFVGSYLSKYLCVKDLALLRLLARNADSDRGLSGAEILQGDLMSTSDCERFADGLQVIFYLAHNNTPVDSDQDLPSDVLVNLVPLLNLLQVIQRLGTKPHLVYFSSGGAIYAPKQDRIPYRESDLCLPMSSYGIQKLAAEAYLRLAAHKAHLTATVLRVGNAYGTLLSQFRMQGLIGVAINCILHRRPVRLFGNPNNVRDYVHLEDVCDIAVRASASQQAFDIVNVGSGIGHSVLDVLRVIEQCRGESLEIHTDSSCGNWLTDWVVLDNQKARTRYDWYPAIDLASGISQMVEFQDETVGVSEASA